MTCSGVRLALFFEAMFPAAEKKRSEGVEAVGIHKNDFASDARDGYFASLNFYQDKRLSGAALQSTSAPAVGQQ